MTFHVITLFPHAFDSYLGESILKRAIEDKKIKVKFYNPRDYAENKRTKTAKGGSSGQRSWLRKRIDCAPYGGGPGMVIQAEPVLKAVETALRNSDIESRISKKGKAKKKSPNTKVIWLTPSGRQFTNTMGVKYAKDADLIIICGRYEGTDARVKKAFRVEEVSVGPFVLTGGELPAMLMIDVIARQVKGVLGDFNSREEARSASPDVYTRPEVFEYRGKKFRVPKILLTGHHARIDEWRQRRKGRKTEQVSHA